MALLRCTNCGSENVEPRGELWHCNACGKDSDTVMGEKKDIGEGPPPKKSRKKGE